MAASVCAPPPMSTTSPPGQCDLARIPAIDVFLHDMTVRLFNRIDAAVAVQNSEWLEKLGLLGGR